MINKAERKRIKDDLKKQLQFEGEQYQDMINTYMSLYDTKNLLVEDINSRGVLVRYDNGGGQTGIKKNESIEQVNKVTQQMLKILETLYLKTPALKESDEYDTL